MPTNNDFSLELLRVIGEEILGIKEYKRINDQTLATVFSLVDIEEQYFHMQDDILWRVKDWKASLENYHLRKQISEKERDIRLRRREVYDALKAAIKKETKFLTDILCHIHALTLIHQHNIKAAKFFGVDITNMPEPYTHIVILDKDYGDYTI